MIYLVIAYTGDYYVPEELYAVCDSKDKAEELAVECINRKSYRPDGTYWKLYEDVEIREEQLNKSVGAGE